MAHVKPQSFEDVLPVNMSTVFLDLESTGLERDRPRVTELEPRHISEEPRVVNKLVLCFNPGGATFNPWALANTGLNPDNLSARRRFSASRVRLLDAFLFSLPSLVYV